MADKEYLETTLVEREYIKQLLLDDNYKVAMKEDWKQLKINAKLLLKIFEVNKKK